LLIAQSNTSLVSGGSVRNAVCVSSQCAPTIFVICMRFNYQKCAKLVETPDANRHSSETFLTKHALIS
jgi:hypothetical protein